MEPSHYAGVLFLYIFACRMNHNGGCRDDVHIVSTLDEP